MRRQATVDTGLTEVNDHSVGLSYSILLVPLWQACLCSWGAVYVHVYVFHLIAASRKMPSQPHQVQTKPLRRLKNPAEFDVYCAGLEWGLVDPIIINDRQDLKSEVRWHDRVKPFQHQVNNLITFCRRLPVTLLADDVGLGKTISAGLIASELISRRRLNRILIVAPKLLGPQWKEELETKFNIPALVAPGKKLLEADPDGDVGAVITTYHSARVYIKRLPARSLPDANTRRGPQAPELVWCSKPTSSGCPLPRSPSRTRI